MTHFRLSTLSVMVAAAVGTAATASAEELTIVSWGGAYTQSQIKAYHEPYTEKTGIQIINVDEGSSAPAQVKAQAEAGQMTWDVVDVVEPDAVRLCDEGLAEEIDYDAVLAPAPDGTPPTEDFIEGSLSGCFIPQIVYATLVAYNTSMFPDDAQPDSIADVFDIATFPGKRSLEKSPYSNLEWALYADGVAIEDIYDTLDTPEGMNRAFAKLDTIKDQVVWWDKGAQPPQLLADKEVSMASGYNGRFFAAEVEEGQPFKTIWDGQVFELDGWIVPKGQLSDTVKDYLYFATDTQRLADQAKYISYGPARNSSAPLVSTHAGTGVDMKPYMPTTPENFENAIKKDALWWADNYDSVSQRFSAWLAQ